jgi:hypothetical protein
MKNFKVFQRSIFIVAFLFMGYLSNGQVSVVITPTSISICAGSVLHYTSSPTGGIYTYQWQLFTGSWNNIPGSVGTTSPLNYYPTSGGILRLRVFSGGTLVGTSASSSFAVHAALPAPSVTPANTQYCDGGSGGTATTLTASAISGATSYQWYDGGTLISGATSSTYTTSNTLAAGSHSYTVTAVNSTCTSAPSAPAIVAVGTAPVVSITSTSPPPACAGTTVTLSASPTGTGYTYLWSDGSTLSTVTFTTPSPSTSYPYSVTVTDANGCTGSDLINQSTYANPTPSITASCGRTFCNGGSVALSASSSYSSYSWTLDGSVVSTLSTYTCAPPTGAHNVLLAVTDGLGCLGTTPVPTVVTAHPCTGCAPAASLPSCQQYTVLGQTGSAGGVYTGGVYFLSSPSGTITVPSDLEFYNATVLVDANTTIDVQNGATFLASVVHMFSCTSKMWNGIVAENGSYINLNTCLIEDAHNAVLSDTYYGGSAILTIEGVIFNKNGNGLVLTNQATGPTLTLEGNIFTSRNFSTWSGWPLSYPQYWQLNAYSSSNMPNGAPRVIANNTYVEKKCNDNNYANAGVYLRHNMANITLGSNTTYFENQNIFDKLLYGIYAKNSFFTVNSCVFEWMQFLGTTMGSDGIYTINDVDSPTTVTIGTLGHTFGNQFYLPISTFSNHPVYGIEADNIYNFSSQGNMIVADQNVASYTAGTDYSNIGYVMSGYNYNDVEITSDTLRNVTTGIEFIDQTISGISNLGIVNIANNQFRKGNNFGFIKMGIDVENACTITPTVSGGITINDNNISPVYYGVYTQQLQGHLVTEAGNQIHVVNDARGPIIAYAPYGIENSGNTNDVVEGNVITGDPCTGCSGDNLNARGIWTEYGYGTKVTCNTAAMMGIGFAFDYCTGNNITWRENVMMQTVRGLDLNASQLGAQGAPGDASDNRFQATLPFNSDTYVEGITNSIDSKLYIQSGSSFEPMFNNSELGSTAYSVGIGGPLIYSSTMGATCPAYKTVPAAVVNIAAKNQSFALSPNPGNGVMKITQEATDAHVNVQIAGVDGRVIYRGPLNFTDKVAMLNLQDMTPGLYMVQLSDSSGKNYNIKYVVIH